jgi:hypothetical protein
MPRDPPPPPRGMSKQVGETEMSNLNEMRRSWEEKRAAFIAAIKAIDPSLEDYHWFRALSNVKGDGNLRKNDDQTYDNALANSTEIERAFDDYILALHAFYRARDGEGKFQKEVLFPTDPGFTEALALFN